MGVRVFVCVGVHLCMCVCVCVCVGVKVVVRSFKALIVSLGNLSLNHL